MENTKIAPTIWGVPSTNLDKIEKVEDLINLPTNQQFIQVGDSIRIPLMLLKEYFDYKPPVEPSEKTEITIENDDPNGIRISKEDNPPREIIFFNKENPVNPVFDIFNTDPDNAVINIEDPVIFNFRDVEEEYSPINFKIKVNFQVTQKGYILSFLNIGFKGKSDYKLISTMQEGENGIDTEDWAFLINVIDSNLQLGGYLSKGLPEGSEDGYASVEIEILVDTNKKEVTIASIKE